MRTAREQAEAIVSRWATSKECYHPLTVYPTALRDAIAAALEEKDRQLAEAVTKIGWFASHASMGLVRGGEGPAIGFLTDVKTHATAFLAKHTHAEKPDGKLQKPLDTHAKPL